MDVLSQPIIRTLRRAIQGKDGWRPRIIASDPMVYFYIAALIAFVVLLNDLLSA